MNVFLVCWTLKFGVKMGYTKISGALLEHRTCRNSLFETSNAGND